MVAKPETLFIRACSTGKHEVVQSLIDGGLSPDTRDTFGLTGLMWAGRKGQIGVAKVLLAGGADLEAKDRRGRTALHHAAAYKRLDFVEFIAAQGAFLNPADAHGRTPLDLASSLANNRLVDLLTGLGARRESTQEPIARQDKKLNSFSSGGAAGGPDLPIEVERIHIQLNAALRNWKGDYTCAVEVFHFPLLVDGSLVRYTDGMKTPGAQRAKRKRDWLEVEIGIPESWWRAGEPSYKKRLTDAIEEGLHSMIALLLRNKHEVKTELLLADWERVRKDFLNAPAPPFAAEEQRAAKRSLVDQVVRAAKGKK